MSGFNCGYMVAFVIITVAVMVVFAYYTDSQLQTCYGCESGCIYNCSTIFGSGCLSNWFRSCSYGSIVVQQPYETTYIVIR